jgi:hypothetical protein
VRRVVGRRVRRRARGRSGEEELGWRGEEGGMMETAGTRIHIHYISMYFYVYKHICISISA